MNTHLLLQLDTVHGVAPLGCREPCHLSALNFSMLPSFPPHVFARPSSELVPYHLRHQRIKFLLPVGSEGLVFASMRSSPFPIVVRMLCSSGDRPSGVGSGGESGVTAYWKMLERSEETRSSPCLGAISDLIVLPALRGDEQEASPCDACANNKTPNTKQRTPNESRSTFREEDAMLRFPEPCGKTTPRGVRVALATRPVVGQGTSCGSSACDPAKCLALLDLGLKLDNDAKGSIGLPEGATLFAQPVSAGGTSCSTGKQRGRSWKEDNRQESADEKDECDESQGGHVLLFSDRVRNTSHVLAVSQEGEVAPALQGETKVQSTRYDPLAFLSRSCSVEFACPGFVIFFTLHQQRCFSFLLNQSSRVLWVRVVSESVIVE